MAAALNLKLATARCLLLKAGYKTAGGWTPEKCEEKILEVSEHLEAAEYGDDEYLQGQGKKVIKAIADKTPIKVEAAAPAAEGEGEEAPPAKPAKKAPPAKPAPAAPAEEATEEAPAKPAKKAAAAKTAEEGGAGKTTKKAAPAKAAEPTMPGVRKSRSRPYLAGIIIKKHTREAGITEEMVKELDTAYGKENPNESMFCLRNAWHAIRGFVTKNNEADLTQEGLGGDAPAE
jgi:hypothetical protein